MGLLQSSSHSSMFIGGFLVLHFAWQLFRCLVSNFSVEEYIASVLCIFILLCLQTGKQELYCCMRSSIHVDHKNKVCVSMDRCLSSSHSFCERYLQRKNVAASWMG